MSTTPRSSSESPSQPVDIRIGTEVYCGADKAGKVERVVISPRRKTVTHLIVGRGMVLHKDIVVPIERVVHADQERVDLDLTIDELKQLPDYHVVDYITTDDYLDGEKPYDLRPALLAPDPYSYVWGPSTSALAGMVVHHERVGVPQDAAIVRRGTHVESRDGKVGVVDHVLLDPKQHTVTHIVVREGHLVHKDVAIPIDWVTEIDDGGVFLGVGRAEIEHLPDYTPGKSDADVASEIREALRSDARTRDAEISVRVDRGDVELAGKTADPDARVAASAITRSVPGVLQTRNRLVVGGNGAVTPIDSSIGVQYHWVEDLLHRATDLHLDDRQAREIVSHAERKLVDILAVAEDAALANGREIIVSQDLPLTRALRLNLVADSRFANDLSTMAIEAYMSDMGILGRVDDKVRARLPGLFVSLLLLEGRVIAAIEGSNVPASERLEALTRTDPSQPTEAEVRRAARVVDLAM